jgi:hypothetical protein
MYLWLSARAAVSCLRTFAHSFPQVSALHRLRTLTFDDLRAST